MLLLQKVAKKIRIVLYTVSHKKAFFLESMIFSQSEISQSEIDSSAQMIQCTIDSAFP